MLWLCKASAPAEGSFFLLLLAKRQARQGRLATVQPRFARVFWRLPPLFQRSLGFFEDPAGRFPTMKTGKPLFHIKGAAIVDFCLRRSLSTHVHTEAPRPQLSMSQVHTTLPPISLLLGSAPVLLQEHQRDQLSIKPLSYYTQAQQQQQQLQQQLQPQHGYYEFDAFHRQQPLPVMVPLDIDRFSRQGSQASSSSSGLAISPLMPTFPCISVAQPEQKSTLLPKRESTSSGLSESSNSNAPASPSNSSASQPIHVDLTDSKSVRKYRCRVCERCFTTSGHLARHSRIHTGERKHVCPFEGCDARFARQDNCMQHFRTHKNVKTRRKRSKKI